MRIFHLRQRSLVRGTLLALASFVVGFALSGFPVLHPNPWLLLPLLFCALGAVDTARCMQKRWNFYHGAVLLLLYTDLMILLLLTFFLVVPYSGLTL
jgi:hypothetical protein